MNDRKSARQPVFTKIDGSELDLETELAAWKQVSDLVDVQRQMIIQRECDGMPELNRRLAQAFADASRMRQASGPPILKLRTDPRAIELDRLQRRVRTAAAINRDLIGDVLAYVNFSLELLCPHATSPVYNQEGRLARRPVTTAVNRSA